MKKVRTLQTIFILSDMDVIAVGDSETWMCCVSAFALWFGWEEVIRLSNLTPESGGRSSAVVSMEYPGLAPRRSRSASPS